jgi:pimeloyl-ACP methyl ester carboxylesterase
METRDISTIFSGGTNNEGEAHGPIVAPAGSVFTSANVGTSGDQIAAYWTQNPNNEAATQVFIMIHGKLRDGDTYWTTMDTVLTSALQDGTAGVDPNAIVVAPEFFSTIFNSGQYSSSELAWDDVNGWQAGDTATHPTGTTLTSFDALDALVDLFADTSAYPAMKNITVVGHGGGGQLIQRYAMVAKVSFRTERCKVRTSSDRPNSPAELALQCAHPVHPR